jgi:hypothetical protein
MRRRIDGPGLRLIGMAIDRAHAKRRASAGDDCSFLLGKKLLEVTFDADRTRLRFEGGASLDIAGDIEHRIGTDIRRW